VLLASRLELLCTSVIACDLGDWRPSGAGPLVCCCLIKMRGSRELSARSTVLDMLAEVTNGTAADFDTDCRCR